MKWTTETPTKIGWYWKRSIGRSAKSFRSEVDVVYIRKYSDELCIQNWGLPQNDVEWAGPIPTPKEA